MPFPAKYDETILNTRGLVLYLPMDDISGTRARDLTRFKNHGTLQGNATLRGNGDDQIVLDGTGDYISVPHNSSLNVGDIYSVEGWALKYGVSIDQILFGKATDTCVMAYGAGSNRLVANKWGFGALAQSDYDVFTELVYFVFTKNGATSRIVYMNGASRNDDVADSTCGNSGNALYLGCDQDAGGTPSAYLDGLMHHFAYYNRVLTAGEVREHYLIARGAM